MRAKDTIVYDFYCTTNWAPSFVRGTKPFFKTCKVFGFRPQLKIEKIIVNICPLSALNALLLLNFNIFPSKLTIVAIFRYFLPIFLVPGHARDPTNFLKTI